MFWLVTLHLPFPVASIFLPILLFFSYMETFAPLFAAVMAATSPDAPAPMMAML